MTANVNPETGVRYGIIAARSVDDYIIDDIFMYGNNLDEAEAMKELRKEVEAEADEIEEQARIGIAETDYGLVGDEDWEEKQTEDAYLKQGYADRDDFITTNIERRSDFQIEEPSIEFELDGVKGQTTWLGGGALHLWIFESPHKTRARLCSPCVPNCGDLDSIDLEDGYECYDVPPDWRKRNDLLGM